MTPVYALGGAMALVVAMAAPAMAQTAPNARPTGRLVDVYPGQTFVSRANGSHVVAAGSEGARVAGGGAAVSEVFQTNRYGSEQADVASAPRPLARVPVDPVPEGIIRPTGAAYSVLDSPDRPAPRMPPNSRPAVDADATAYNAMEHDLDRLAPEGEAQFGDRSRWYLYAASSDQAVGYNWARDRDGEYSRAGMTRDDGVFMGDASIGVAMRRGNLHGSVGLVYREIEAEGLRAVHGVDTDVSEGLIAFQLSFKPD